MTVKSVHPWNETHNMPEPAGHPLVLKTIAAMMTLGDVKVVPTAEVPIGTVGEMIEMGVLETTAMIEMELRVAVAAVATDGIAKEAEIAITMTGVHEARNTMIAALIQISPARKQQFKMRAMLLTKLKMTCVKLKIKILPSAKHSKVCKQTSNRK